VSEPFVEFREVSAIEPLRQGDVLESVDATASMWTRHLIVITADCDFAFGKHQGRVTCVPFLTTDEYLLEMQVPRIRDRLARKPLDELVGILREKYPNITSDRVRQWASEEDAASIVETLRLSENYREQSRLAFDSLRRLDAPVTSLAKALQALTDAQLSSRHPPSKENAVKNVRGRLQDAFSQTPGDAMYLGAIAPGIESGYFAYLRHLEQVREPSIATTPTHQDVSYRRVSRLQDRYMLALVQKFALVFMSIGLPPDYEEARDRRAALIGDEDV
jgi:hypothetical protein